MDCSDKRRCGHRGQGGISLKLWIDHELIDVWLDDTGIHFRHPSGTQTEGHLPWSVAISTSLLPQTMRRAYNAQAA